LLSGDITGYAESILYSALAAVACADLLGISSTDIAKGLSAIKPVPGRMQPLKGIKHSLLLDDSYNASPEATKAALDTLYKLKGSQKIALLGNMNELGDYSQEAHEEIGAYCDPKQLDLVVTLGPDANSFTAYKAIQKGCNVKTVDSPYAAGKFIAQNLKDHAVILVKGSQNGVFAEEALKYLLADAADKSKLVRQSAAWLRKKQEQFADYEA
jgi:UDP-N-acetylmuramoyl-tripeptide--D-alanyl-D-alanine ligase